MWEFLQNAVNSFWLFVEHVSGWKPGPETKAIFEWASAVLGTIVGIIGIAAMFRGGGAPTKKDIKSEMGAVREVVHDEIRGIREEVGELRKALEAAQTRAQGDAFAGPAAELAGKDLEAGIETLLKAGREEALRDKTGEAAQAALDDLIAQRAGARERIARDEAALWRQKGAFAYLHDTDAALRAYAKAAEIDPDNAEGLIFLGELQQRAGYLDAAKQSFERVIALGNRIDNPQLRHWAYFLLGDVEAALGNRSPALDQYERGQSLLQSLLRSDPNNAEWQRDLSVSYNKIGDIRAARGDRDGALKAYEDGLDIRKRLAARDPNNAEWQRDLSVSYDRVGDIRAARGDRDGALKAYEDGLDIRKRLAARDPNNAEWQRDLSVSYDRVGDIRAARGDRDGALKAYEDGLDIRKRLAARDPNNVQWQTDVVVSYVKLAQAGAANGEALLRDALAILLRLDAEDRLTHEQKDWIGAIRAALGNRA